MKSKVSHLKSHIGYHLRVVSNEVSLAFSKRLDQYEVTVAEWVILLTTISIYLKYICDYQDWCFTLKKSETVWEALNLSYEAIVKQVVKFKMR